MEDNMMTPEEAGFSMIILAGPYGLVKDDWGGPSEMGKARWTCIHYRVEVKIGDKTVIKTDFYLGVGHVKKPTKYLQYNKHLAALPARHRNMLDHWIDRPSVKFIDQETFSEVVAAVAKATKVAPTLDQVMASLILDGSPCFDHQSHKDWCDDFGYDADSMRAKKMYNQCMETGQAIARHLPNTTLYALRNWASEQ
jgi:hypothetical protein